MFVTSGTEVVTVINVVPESTCMELLRFLPVFTLAGAVVGVIAVLSPWFAGMTGLDVMTTDYEDFQKYIPVMILVLAVIAAALAVIHLLVPGFVLIPFITFFFGVAIMLLTSLFTMWTIDGVKVVQSAGIGLWMSYISGVLIIAETAILYAMFARRPQRIR